MHNSEQPLSLALDSRRVLNLPKFRDSGYSRRYQEAEVSRANETNCKRHLLLIREDEMGTDDNITEPRTVAARPRPTVSPLRALPACPAPV
ncbi:uncharacterized protein BO87DRAFT_242088 [Aspergillus neoniger CBS 115656]|uniref:Uncharacterized protein n=1 Tax=Aspergillus neoniger (strain CBS 115656) TaxID=1448310 RepID=A0A318YXS9_ASPNB|nr:hypothetical protein BO87DRAFT_242088 [Aspergillus neoniger CBS 115656]PYH36560.1 hypothetical protein BO87DRAFT_242088 [Aspergillus neoniger CBS 115656]